MCRPALPTPEPVLREAATLAATWLFVGVPVGAGVVAVGTAPGGPAPLSAPGVPLAPVHAVVALSAAGSLPGALFAVVRLTVAAGLAFAGGYRALYDRARAVVVRLARTPPDDSPAR